MTDMLQTLIDEGHDVGPAFIDGGWVEIDTVDDMNLQIPTIKKNNWIIFIFNSHCVYIISNSRFSSRQFVLRR